MKQVDRLVRAVLFLFPAAVMLGSGCSKDPVSPGVSGPEPDVTEVIGSAGGILEAEGISLTVPTGAFSSQTEVRLYLNAHNEFSDRASTGAYEIGGLPAVYTKPLRLSLKHSGSLSDESYIACGVWNYDPAEGDTTLLHYFRAAQDSSGFLVCSLPPSGGGATGTAKRGVGEEDAVTPNSNIQIRGVTNYIMVSSSEHFHIYYPENMGGNVFHLRTILEDCYNRITETMGFSYDQYAGFWPMEVTVTDIKSYKNIIRHADGGYYGIREPLFSPNLNGIPYLAVNRASLAAGMLSEIKTELGMNLLQLTLSMYGGLYSTLFDPAHRWLSTAGFNWSQEYFANGTGFTHPFYFRGNEMAPFSGMRTGAGQGLTAAENHGRGMSALLKYLADRPLLGVQGLSNVYDDIKAGTYSAKALITGVDGLIADWWPDFFHTYLNGEIYNVQQERFLETRNICRTWTIDSENEIQKSFTSSDVEHYDHLSAKLFLVNLDYSGFSTTDNLFIDANGTATDNGIAVIVFGVKNGQLQFLGKTKNEDAAVELNNLKDYYDNGWEGFLIAVVNSLGQPPYTGQSNIDLDLEVREATAPPEWKTASIRVVCNRHYFRQHADGRTDYFTADNVLATYSFYEGTFSGNTFTSNYTYTDNPAYTKEGTLVITLNQSLDKVTSVTWDETKKHTKSDYVSTIGFSAENLDYDPSYNGAEAFKVTGAGSGDHITRFIHTVRHPGANDYDLQSWEGDSDSAIYVLFREQ